MHTPEGGLSSHHRRGGLQTPPGRGSYDHHRLRLIHNSNMLHLTGRGHSRHHQTPDTMSNCLKAGPELATPARPPSVAVSEMSRASRSLKNTEQEPRADQDGMKGKSTCTDLGTKTFKKRTKWSDHGAGPAPHRPHSLRF